MTSIATVKRHSGTWGLFVVIFLFLGIGYLALPPRAGSSVHAAISCTPTATYHGVNHRFYPGEKALIKSLPQYINNNSPSHFTTIWAQSIGPINRQFALANIMRNVTIKEPTWTVSSNASPDFMIHGYQPSRGIADQTETIGSVSAGDEIRITMLDADDPAYPINLELHRNGGGKTLLKRFAGTGHVTYYTTTINTPGTLKIYATGSGMGWYCKRAGIPPTSTPVPRDTTPPTIPGHRLLTCAYDRMRNGVHHYTVAYTHGKSSDAGVGLHKYAYWSQISTRSNFSTVVSAYNTWDNVLARVSATSLAGGTRVYARARARDANDNQSNWSPSSSILLGPSVCSGTPIPPTNTPVPQDTTAPTIPGNRRLTCSYDRVRSGVREYTVSFSHGNGVDAGIGLHSSPYWSQISTRSNFSRITGWFNSWGNRTQQTSTTAFAEGTRVYGRIRARDALNNQSNWSSSSSIILGPSTCTGTPLPPTSTPEPQDTTPPSIPGNRRLTCSFDRVRNGANQYSVSYSFGASTDTGVGLHTYPYWSQISTRSNFSNVPGWYNSWDDEVTRQSSRSFNEGVTIYAHVRSRDSNNNQSNWSRTQSIVLNSSNCVGTPIPPTATLIPTITPVLPTPTDILIPTNTPVLPTPTAIPTNTPIPTSTSRPSRTPTPTLRFTPTPTNTPTPSPIGYMMYCPI